MRPFYKLVLDKSADFYTERGILRPSIFGNRKKVPDLYAIHIVVGKMDYFVSNRKLIFLEVIFR